jgi:hypothetical protein
MAKNNLKLKSRAAQAKLFAITFTEEQMWLGHNISCGALDRDLSAIDAIATALDYTSDFCRNGEYQEAEGNMSIIVYGLGEALKLAHGRIVRAIEVK